MPVYINPDFRRLAGGLARLFERAAGRGHVGAMFAVGAMRPGIKPRELMLMMSGTALPPKVVASARV